MRPMNSSKNKLNSKISWVFNLEPNAHQVLLKKKKKKKSYAMNVYIKHYLMQYIHIMLCNEQKFGKVLLL